MRDGERSGFFVLLWAIVFAWTGAAFAQGLETLNVLTSSGAHPLSVEVMRSGEDRAQGLMYRRALPQNRGMLFDFGEAQSVTMWMKNTYLSLDMIFIRPDGTIARIAERTEPLSTRVIPSGEAVLGVLEVEAGTAQRWNVKPGDRIDHALFTTNR